MSPLRLLGMVVVLLSSAIIVRVIAPHLLNEKDNVVVGIGICVLIIWAIVVYAFFTDQMFKKAKPEVEIQPTEEDSK
jgi:hypothetical protein